MNLCMACINHQPLEIRLLDESFKELLPNFLVSPSAETTMGILPITIARRQVSPRCTGAQYPEYGIDKESVVTGNTTPAARSPGK